nr:reverse transcriptase domain-containing protein [Tanacetum cinerariifolium]
MGSICVVQQKGRFISNVHRLSRVGLADHQKFLGINNLFDQLQGRDMDTLSLRLCLLGLTNAPAVFMDLMNWDHEVHLKLVLELLKKEKLFV